MIRIQLPFHSPRRRIAVVVLVLIALGAASLFAQGTPDAEDVIPNAPLSWVGEKIDYHVSFGVVPAGKASLSVESLDTLNGQPVLHLVSLARSAKAFDVVFKVRDRVESWCDADSVYSVRFRKLLQGGALPR